MHHTLASASISWEFLEVGPICWKKPSRSRLKIPKYMVCSMSIGHAPWIPVSLCSPWQA
jgi:hypothetical protein